MFFLGFEPENDLNSNMVPRNEEHTGKSSVNPEKGLEIENIRNNYYPNESSAEQRCVSVF